MNSDTIATIKAALESAERFITNGIGFGYIRMTYDNPLDPAHETLPQIHAALADIAALEQPQPAQPPAMPQE